MIVSKSVYISREDLETFGFTARFLGNHGSTLVSSRQQTAGRLPDEHRRRMHRLRDLPIGRAGKQTCADDPRHVLKEMEAGGLLVLGRW